MNDDSVAALDVREVHPFVRERIASVVRSFSWYRAGDFGRTADIAWYWLALGRTPEARALADELADGIPADATHNLSSVAANVICLAARLAREAGDTARHGQLIARIATTRDYITPAERPYLEQDLERSRAAIESNRLPGALDDICSELADALSSAVYYAETLRADRFRWQQWLSLAAVEQILSDGLQLLGDHLAGRVTLPARVDIGPLPAGHTGLLLVNARAIPADFAALWWVDLATGDSGRVAHARSTAEVVAVRDASAAWLFRVLDEQGPGATLVERSPTGVVSSFVPNLDAFVVSSDGRQTVLVDPADGSLRATTIDTSHIARGGDLGVTAESYNRSVIAALADGSAIIKTTDGDEALVQRHAVGTLPELLLRVEARTDVYASHDGRILVTIRRVGDDTRDDTGDDADYVDPELELSVHRPSTSPATATTTPPTLPLGRGGPADGRFAAGNRYFVVSVLDQDGAARVLSIDLATSMLVELAADSASPFVISPDGRFVVIWCNTLSIVPITGGPAQPTTLDGCPYGWLR